MFEEYGIKGVDCKNQGWVRREINSQMENLTNQRFGRLVVLFPVEQKDRQSTQWLCQCDCGNLKVTKRILLKKGKTKSCGCLRSEVAHKKALKTSNIQPGDRYGALTVLEYLESRPKCNGELVSFYKCKCDCGTIVEVSGNSLKTGNKKSCGFHSSIGELTIYNLLIKNKIKFKHQFSFTDLVNESNNKLRFDFAIFNKKDILLFLLEYQGSQHYIASGRQWNTKENLEKVKQSDKLKKEYCIKNNIPLYEITYTDNIEKKLMEICEQYEIE